MVIRLDPRHRRLDGDLLLTTACPVECEFCVYSCTAEKEEEKWMPEEVIRRVAEQYSKNDIGVRIGGGEPFYDFKKLRRCLGILLEYYKPCELLVITSGFWGGEKDADKKIYSLHELGLDRMVISVDRFHQKKVPLSSIENIIRASGEVGLEAVLRLSIDNKSQSLVEEISPIIARHRAQFECHAWGAFGRGESLDTSCLSGVEKATESLYSLVAKHAQACGSPRNMDFYLAHSAKRNQLEHANGFFPTTFPGGSVYGCSMAMKGSYMGNILREDLGSMMQKWALTLPGYFNIHSTSCEILAKFAGGSFPSRCNFCRNHFSPEADRLPEAMGRFLFAATPGATPKTGQFDGREWLMSLRLKKEDLTPASGRWLAGLCGTLAARGVRFMFSRPVPRCLGPVAYRQPAPRSCFDCAELFSVREGRVRFCSAVREAEGPPISDHLDRKKIYALFEKERSKMGLPEKCESCRYLLRRQCNGLCFGGGPDA